MKATGYETFETLRRQNAVLRDTVELNSGIWLTAWYNNCDTVTIRSDHHTLSLYVADGYESCQKTPHDQKNGGGSDRFCLMPKGGESVWDIRDDLSFVHLYCTDEHLRRVGEEVQDHSPANFTLQKETFASDSKITTMHRQFLLANDWRQPANQLTLSTASNLLLIRLVQHCSTAQWRLPTVTRGLVPGAKRYMLAWTDAHLDQPLTPTDLAQQVGLGEFHLARVFRQSLNMAPHQYVTQQRMAKVQNLSCHSMLPLAEIALACDFSSVSHFSHRAKAAADLAPSRLRAAQRG